MCEQAPKFHTGVYIIVAGMLRESRAGLLCHSGARAEFANPESRPNSAYSSGYRARAFGASRNDGD
jgi:hypothetical protein